MAIAIVVTVTTFVGTVLGLQWLENYGGVADTFIISLALLAVAAYAIRTIRRGKK